MRNLKRYYCWARQQGTSFPYSIMVIKAYSLKQAKEKAEGYDLEGKVKKSDLPVNAL